MPKITAALLFEKMKVRFGAGKEEQQLEEKEILKWLQKVYQKVRAAQQQQGQEEGGDPGLGVEEGGDDDDGAHQAGRGRGGRGRGGAGAGGRGRGRGRVRVDAMSAIDAMSACQQALSRSNNSKTPRGRC
jgi:hypothetical protein